jgi:lipase maturation factor 1
MANYAFLNYIVLALGFLLLDDRSLVGFVPTRWRAGLRITKEPEPQIECDPSNGDSSPASEALPEIRPARIVQHLRALRQAAIAIVLSWIFYATTAPMLQMFWRGVPLLMGPVTALEPFRIANQYGLFAVMTPHRYEIEFQGSNDGFTWVAYPFRYKPQDITQRPRIYAPYQPRFDWNLWFASLGSWSQYPIVPRTEELLLINDSDVLQLFAGNPFPDKPPRLVRAVLWQYWFSTMKEKRAQRIWWRRQLLGTYAPTLMVGPNGRIITVAEPLLSEPQE